MPVGNSPSDPKAFHGQESVVEIGDALSSVTSDNPLDEQMSNATEFSARIIDITVTDPEASIDIENTFGGQVKTESPPDLVEVDFTCRFKDIEMFEQLHGTGSTYTTSGDSYTWTRISGTKDVGRKRNRAILFRMKKTVNSTDYELNYLLNNAVFQQMGEISMEADGVAELTGTAVALVGDRYIEKNW